MKKTTILFAINVCFTLSGMENNRPIDAIKKHLITYFRNEIILQNGQNKQFTYHKLESFQNAYRVVTDHNGHKCVIPECLLHNNKYRFNGPKLSDDQHGTSDTYKISPDGNYLAQIITTHDFQDTVTLTNLTNKFTTTLFDNQEQTMSLCFSPDSSALFIGGATEQQTLQKWSTDTKQLLHAANIPAIVTAMTCNHAGTVMATCGSDTDQNIISVWKGTNISTATFPSSDSAITHAYFNKKDDTLLATMLNGTMIILKITDGVIANAYLRETNDPARFSGIVYPIFTHNGQFLVTINHYYPTSSDKKSSITVWETENYIPISSLPTNLPVCGIGLTPDKRSIVATFTDLTMHKTDLFDNDTHQCLQHIKNCTCTKTLLALETLYLHHNNGTLTSDDDANTINETLQKLPTEPNVQEMMRKYFTVIDIV